MAESFSVYPSYASEASGSESGLRDEIRTHTGSDEETESIMRSIAVFGVDPSIQRFDLTPSRSRNNSFAARVAWSVHAVREPKSEFAS